jgi:hypothetical protein
MAAQLHGSVLACNREHAAARAMVACLPDDCMFPVLHNRWAAE